MTNSERKQFWKMIEEFENMSMVEILKQLIIDAIKK